MWSLQPPAQAKLEATVYFIRSTERYLTLAPVTREVSVGLASEGNAASPLLRAALVALLEGPTEAERARGLSSAFPPEARLLALEVKGNEVTVDLSAAFASGGGTSLMQGRLFQLLYTLSEPETLTRVRVKLEGVPVRVFSGEGLLLEQPWTRPSRGTLPVW